MKLSAIRNFFKKTYENTIKIISAPAEKSFIVSEKKPFAIKTAENKGNILITCWNDGKETWVRKGSRCHTTGLCSKCLQNGVL